MIHALEVSVTTIEKVKANDVDHTIYVGEESNVLNTAVPAVV